MSNKSNQDTLQQFDCCHSIGDSSVSGDNSDKPVAENKSPMAPCSVLLTQSAIANSDTVSDSLKAMSNSQKDRKPLPFQNTADYNDQDWMQYALALADKAEAVGEIPVGAVLVKNNEVIAEGWNLSILEHNACAHAEIIAITNAGKVLKNYRLIDCTLYVTLEPCPMCAGALVHARIKRLVYGAGDYKTGAAGSVFDLVRNEHLNHQIEVTSGIYAEQCATKISDFFRRRRKEKKAFKLANKGDKGNV